MNILKLLMIIQCFVIVFVTNIFSAGQPLGDFRVGYIDEDNTKLHQLCELASMTYNDITHLKGSKITKDFVLRERRKTPVSKLVYALATDSKTGSVIIAFRGSACTENWVLNADSDLVDVGFPNDSIRGQVHRGFLNAVTELYPDIKRDFEQLKAQAPSRNYGKREIIFVGHSLGGALATLTAASFLSDSAYTFRANQIKILGLAEPCVGDWDFSQSLGNALERGGSSINHVRAYVNGDLVPGVSKIVNNRYRAHGLGVRLNYRTFLRRNPIFAITPFLVHYSAHDSSYLMKFAPLSIKSILRINVEHDQVINVDGGHELIVEIEQNISVIDKNLVDLRQQNIQILRALREILEGHDRNIPIVQELEQVMAHYDHEEIV